ncbi:MAG: TetR/AcrR family transcriptional regulator [Chloroflexota bacterium]
MANKKKEDRRVRRTRKLLQNALLRLLREKPLAKIQIKEIVEVADVSRPTFYLHFETKEQLLFSHVDDVFARINALVFSDLKPGQMVNILQLLTASFEQWEIHKEELKWVMQVENKDRLISLLQTHVVKIKQQLDSHIQPNEVDEELEAFLVSFLSGGVYMLVKRWLDTGMRESPEKMASMASLMLFNIFLARQLNPSSTPPFNQQMFEQAWEVALRPN